jgi:hypothetical protein
MPQEAEARAWWAEVEQVRERIERRRASESGDPRALRRTPTRRGVRELRTGPRLTLVRTEAPDPAERTQLRRRPRPRAAQRIGPRPDRIAAWAVALGVLLLVLAVLSAHG